MKTVRYLSAALVSFPSVETETSSHTKGIEMKKTLTAVVTIALLATYSNAMAAGTLMDLLKDKGASVSTDVDNSSVNDDNGQDHDSASETGEHSGSSESGDQGGSGDSGGESGGEGSGDSDH